jgi:predicted nuclease of predicted toxin-antitoxin system
VILWVDAQLSPHLAPWLEKTFRIDTFSARRLGLHRAEDHEIFHAAREAGAVVLTKDQDFVHLLEHLGPPPQVIWITCGNTSNAHLRTILSVTLTRALLLLEQGESLVEISDAPPPAAA